MYILANNKRLQDALGNDQEFSRLVKHGNDLVCYLKGGSQFTIGNVNWENLSVEGGEFEIKVTKEELLLKEIANLKLENKKKDLIAKNLMQQVAEIRLNLKKEGN